MAETQNTPTRKTRDTKATRPSPMPGLSEAEFEALVKEENSKPEAQRSPVIARKAKEYDKQKKEG